MFHDERFNPAVLVINEQIDEKINKKPQAIVTEYPPMPLMAMTDKGLFSVDQLVEAALKARAGIISATDAALQ